MTNALKLSEVAHRLGISERTARRYVRSGELPSVYYGAAYRVSEEDLEEFIESRRSKPGKAQAPNKSGPHEGLVMAHRAAARLGHTVANSFTNFQRRDLEHLKTFHALEAALAKMRPQDIYGHGPEDLADAQDELGAASHEVTEAMKEHFGVDPSLEPWDEALQHVREEMEARQRV